MNKHARAAALIAALMNPGTATFAAEGVSLIKDLTDAIRLIGLPCGQVTSAKRQAENDHIATCKDGNRYRVYLNAQGRVVAEKQ